MTDLKQQQCEACTSDSQPVTAGEIEQLRSQIPGWQVLEREGILRLEKTYKFPDFKNAIAFTNAVGDEAEREGHHPALLTEWGKVTVTWWTHAISGLHKNDFVMAAKTDLVKAQMS